MFHIFVCIFDQINAALRSKRDCFKKKYWFQTSERYIPYIYITFFPFHYFNETLSVLYLQWASSPKPTFTRLFFYNRLFISQQDKFIMGIW